MRWLFLGIDRLKARVPPPGHLALAAFAICALSGLPLLLVYRLSAPLESLALMMMKNPVGAWVRSVHHWSAQCFLVCAILYLIDCLARREETRGPFAAWLRLVLTGPVIVFALLSGFILRGDSASEQAVAVFRGLLHVIPPGGSLLALALLGPGPDLTVVFWHHVVTVAIVLALLLLAHFRRLAPERRPLWWMLLLVFVLSVLWAPGLGVYLRAAEAAPWYLAGLQEVLRWAPQPGLVVGLVLSALVVLATLPALAAPLRVVAKWSLAVVLLVYAVVTVAAPALCHLTRAKSAAAVPMAAGSGFVSFRSYLPLKASLQTLPVATVAGRPEGCLSCHQGMTGFSPVHNPAVIGCTSCHLGNPFTLDAQLAHAGMTLTPGNLSIVRETCATAGCHADIVTRVQVSLMNTMSGVIAVDKVVFGESADLNHHYDVGRLGVSPADRHLRNLCASCHLGQDKLQPAAIDQQSRGGGCSACHLDYGADALAELHRRGTVVPAAAPWHHPDISTSVPANACFGCHSRSGRISTNYEGWHETLLDQAAARRFADWAQHYRILEDGRVFARQVADVHFEKGMICADCHLASEVMSDGAAYTHEANAVTIACTDCHSDQPPATATFTQLDQETQKLVALRRLNQAERQFVRVQAGDVGYPNVFLDETGGLVLETIRGAILRPKPPARACGWDILAHQKLECRTCHSAWAPQCISCHTSFDPKPDGWDHLAGRFVRGVWQETGGDFRAEPPVLGVERIKSAAGAPAERIATFIPGMVMTLNKTMGAAKLPNEFHRLYAPTAPHTIVTRARDCLSCHANSLALGYGRGVLKYEIKDGRGHWEFSPALPPSGYDALPVDAWIGFMEEPRAPAATRTNVRPFNRQEQQRMLLVGACLQCHSDKEPRIVAVFADFGGYRAKLSPQCILPDWME